MPLRLLTAALLAAFATVFPVLPVEADEIFVVSQSLVPDQKAVFATVESRRVVPARARIGGTLAELAVREGDHVALGQTIATVGDEKLALQLKSLDAQIAGLEAQFAQAKTDFDRADDLFNKGIAPRSRLDEVRTIFNVANNALKARVAEKSVIQQQLAEGAVLAPAAGRVLKVPLTIGTVIMAGETVAQIAEENFVLRLRVPERHARFLKVGDTIRVDETELKQISGQEDAQTLPRFGKIKLVYPQIEEGRVVADAEVEGLGDYFVSERIRVWIAAGERKAFVIPERFIVTRFGVDYVRLHKEDGTTTDVPVQRGRAWPQPSLPDGIEILSGLHEGDRLVMP